MQYDGATGWLIGEPHDGMRAMFTMMNNARLGVGGQGIGAAEGLSTCAHLCKNKKARLDQCTKGLEQF